MIELGNVLEIDNIQRQSIRSVFSKFNARDDRHRHIYDTLKLTHAFQLRYKDSYFSVSLFIQRIEYREDIPHVYETTTMTDLKSYWGKWYRTGSYESITIVREAAEKLKSHAAHLDLSVPIDCILLFKNFIAINAQSNSDWLYGQYGSTKTYAVVGAQYVSLL